jgi:hypothetical protein
MAREILLAARMRMAPAIAVDTVINVKGIAPICRAPSSAA